MASEVGGETLSLQNGVRCVVGDGVLLEEVLLAMGDQIGCQNIYSASRMNKAVVVFLTKKTLVTTATKNGIRVRDVMVQVAPLSVPATRVLVSNVPPFIKDEQILRELARFGKFTGPMKPIPLGCKSSSVKHVLSFRRQVLMILNDQEGPLNVNFKVKDGNNSYTVFATTEPLRCFECGDVGHKRLSCPHGAVQPGSSRGDTAGKQRQRREDSEQGSTEESVPAAGLADTPELQRVSTEHTGSTETHPALGAEPDTGTTVHSASAEPDAGTVLSADSDHAPNVRTETPQPQTSAPPQTPKDTTTTKPRRKREETTSTEPTTKRKTRSQTQSAAARESEEAACSTAHTPVDIEEQVNLFLQLSKTQKKQVVKTLKELQKTNTTGNKKTTDTQKEEKMDNS